MDTTRRLHRKLMASMNLTVNGMEKEYYSNITHQMVNKSATYENQTSEDLDESLLQTHPYLSGFLLCLYGVIFIVGIFGNVMVIYVVIKYKAMQSITNKFIACLAISDVLICLFAIPFTPINVLTTSWIFGKAMCKLVPLVQVVSVLVSTLISVVIAMDRYMSIVHPHIPRMKPTFQAVVIASVWILSVTTAIPLAVYSTEVNENGILVCREQWLGDPAEVVYTWFILSLQLIVPAIAITICYSAVSIKLCRRAEIRLGSRTEARMVMETRRNRRINKMLIAMVVIFILCWLPLDLYHLMARHIKEDHRLFVFLGFHVIAMSSVMYNPFLYGWMNENFNTHFRSALPLLNKKQMKGNTCLTLNAGTSEVKEMTLVITDRMADFKSSMNSHFQDDAFSKLLDNNESNNNNMRFSQEEHI